ncbi:hypothetical protein [Avibacterium avium]|uniref:MuF-C-terminal domain-containing protein n=1 Tax=Avibacterium avium TaxID=751 RepID=UPI003BF8B1A8
MNNPIAVTRSRTQDNGYLVFTELTENVDGVDKPVIAALHIKEKNNGLEVIDVASAYGRNISQINEDLKQVLYWNKTKGYPFANRAGLQLPNVILSEDNLSKNNIRTEDDLSQYQNNKETRYSLNESADSDFAKAVDAVAQGGSVKGYIDVGTTPDVLKILGLPDVKVTIHGATFKKVMQDKHNVTAETLKQLPEQINDPVAVMKSAPQATQQGYVILTELVEDNPLTGGERASSKCIAFKTRC